jgi:hypothetical protein
MRYIRCGQPEYRTRRKSMNCLPNLFGTNWLQRMGMESGRPSNTTVMETHTIVLECNDLQWKSRIFTENQETNRNGPQPKGLGPNMHDYERRGDLRPPVSGR